MRRVRDDGDTLGLERLLDGPGVDVLQTTIAHVLALVSDRSLSAGDDGGGQAGGKYEPGGVRTDHVDQVGRGGNVPADDAVSLAEGTGDDVDPVLHATLDRQLGLVGRVVRLEIQVFGDPSSSGTVHPDGMNLVQKGQRAVLVGEVTNLFDRSHAPAHRVDGLESDDLGSLLGDRLQLGLEVGDVVVLEDDLFRTRMPDPLDHTGVVALVGKDDAPGQLGTERGERGVVGNIAGGKDQGGRLAVQRGEFVFEREVHGTVPSDVSGTPRAGSVAVQGFPTESNANIVSILSSPPNLLSHQPAGTHFMVSKTTPFLLIPK